MLCFASSLIVITCWPGFAEYHFSVCKCLQCSVRGDLRLGFCYFWVMLLMYVICQGMSWQHLHQPCGWKGGTLSLALALSLSLVLPLLRRAMVRFLRIRARCQGLPNIVGGWDGVPSFQRL